MIVMKCSSASSLIASSILISESSSNPYPDLISTVVVPCFIIASRRFEASFFSSFFDALRVALTVLRMPPPPAAISLYVFPLARIANSFSRLPAKTIWVWESTNPGRATYVEASRTVASSPSDWSNDAAGPIALIVSPSMSTETRSRMPGSRISFPAKKGLPSERTVTNCLILRRRSCMGRPGYPFRASRKK